MKKISPLLSSDKFQLFAAVADAAMEGLPIVGIAGKVSKARDEFQLNMINKKLKSAFQEIEGTSHTLISLAVNNLKEEYGFDYADDVFLDAIYAANSSEMARIPGKVFRAYCEKHISLDQYWALLNIVKVLIYPDIRMLLETKNNHISDLPIDAQQRLQTAGFCYPTSGYGKLNVEWNFELVDPLVFILTGEKQVQYKKYNAEKFPRNASDLPEA